MERILITGSNRGIGLALVQQYLRRGDVHIFATCRTPEQATELQAFADNLTLLPLDTQDDASIAACAASIAQHTDGLDILINNAGINPKDGHVQSLENITRETMLQVFDTNSAGTLMVTKAHLDLLRNGNNVRVINVSSQLGSMVFTSSGGSYAYRTSKAAMNMITRCLSGDLRDYGITTITIHPGWVQTDMGGGGAPLTVEESAASIINLIDGLSADDNGNYYNWDGSSRPW